MQTKQRTWPEPAPKLFDLVELLEDRPSAGLKAGAVGSVVEELSAEAVLVEFSDEEGAAIALEVVAIDKVAVH